MKVRTEEEAKHDKNKDQKMKEREKGSWCCSGI